MATTNKVSHEIKRAIRDKYAWPGGYPLYLVCDDGGSLCIECSKKEYRQIVYSIRHNVRDGWKVEGVNINWEDTYLCCDHCGEKIESAYGEQQEEN